jgi:pimeloyl-ACP methyl ester carboxylesterase
MNRNILKAVLAIFFVAMLATVADLRHGAQASDSKNSAMPPASIPTFSTDNIGREGFFYVGGEYAGPAGKEVMHGPMYVEVMVPKQIKQKYPIVFFHGNGQSGTVWKQTPDGRPGWAYYLINQGYVVYMVDYPARGRSPYVPEMDGKLGLRTALELINQSASPSHLTRIAHKWRR